MDIYAGKARAEFHLDTPRMPRSTRVCVWCLCVHTRVRVCSDMCVYVCARAFVRSLCNHACTSMRLACTRTHHIHHNRRAEACSLALHRHTARTRTQHRQDTPLRFSLHSSVRPSRASAAATAHLRGRLRLSRALCPPAPRPARAAEPCEPVLRTLVSSYHHSRRNAWHQSHGTLVLAPARATQRCQDAVAPWGATRLVPRVAPRPEWGRSHRGAALEHAAHGLLLSIGVVRGADELNHVTNFDHFRAGSCQSNGYDVE
jgi:hypothetical protein